MNWKAVKVSYPLKQGLKPIVSFFIVFTSFQNVKVSYPLKQGLKLREVRIFFLLFSR